MEKPTLEHPPGEGPAKVTEPKLSPDLPPGPTRRQVWTELWLRHLRRAFAGRMFQGRFFHDVHLSTVLFAGTGGWTGVRANLCVPDLAPPRSPSRPLNR